MGDFDPTFVRSLAAESWSLYSVGMFLIILRIYARIHRLGIKGLQNDDYGMLLAGAFYTILVVCLNVIASGGGSNLYPPELFPTFSEQNIQDRIHGSKIVILSEQAMLNVIYVIKACMLLMYTRLTLGLAIQRMVFYLSIYTFIGWAATEIAFFTACTPFSGYWAMPPPNPQCTTLEHYAIVQACFNISSDTLMLLIPLPLITRLNVPWKQKYVLMIIFSMGTFVILAAVLTKVFNLSNIWDPSYMLWYMREASVAVYVSNLPLIWPLMRDWFPALRKLTPGTKSSSRDKRQGYGLSSRPRTTTIAGRHLSGNFGGKRLSNVDSENDHKTGVTTIIRGKGESSEDISSAGGDEDMEMGGVIQKTDSWDQLRSTHDERGGEWDIHMSTTVEIREEHIEGPIEAIGAVPIVKAAERGSNNSPAPIPVIGRGDNFKWDFAKSR
ncbi:hypothetical protein BGZ60DRAFT_527754 [Tricladium varicosporioides]|nr:hypothetical protein BGZ60DRAFT_527754 [Hymenoscyphus varicosporioides]